MPELLRLEESFDAMGSTFAIILYGYDGAKMRAAVRAAFGEAERLENMLSPYRPASEWCEVNRHAGHRPVKVSPELFRLLSRCLEFSRQSDGAFDISVCPLVKAWGFFKGAGRLPAPSEVAAALGQVGYRHIYLDPEARTVRFGSPGAEMDPGGIGKGYAVDCMVEILRTRGFDTGLVSGAGSSIYGLGSPPAEARGWPVEICDPRNPRKAAAEVHLRDMAMSTSGSVNKFFRAEGRLYAHILNPRTGYPAQGMMSVSVIAPQTLDSEAWTKACFINGRRWAARRKPGNLRVFFCPERTEATGPAGTWLR